MKKIHLFPRSLQNLFCLAILLTASSVPAQLSFLKANYPAGKYSYMVSTADFNGDGHNDVAVTNNFWDEESVKGVTILLNDGTGVYGAPVTYATGESADNLHVGDLNGDGYPDVAVVSRVEYKLTILLNDGHGTFTITDDYDVSDAYSVRIADFDGDGKPDIATGEVVVLINNGDGTLADGVVYDSGGLLQLNVGDVNNDSYPDIVATNGLANGVSVLLNQGDGTFAPRTVYPTGEFANSVIIDDLDGDGWKDLAVTNRNDNTLSILLNNGNGTFAPQVVYPVNYRPGVLAAGDLDGDGHPDLAMVDQDYDAGGVTIMLNNGDGTFRPGTTLGDGEGTRVGVDIADLDGDGLNDIVVSLAGWDMVSVFLNTSALPVTLTAFQAIAQEESVLLTWSTSEEVNFSHFEIQRSADAGQWQQIEEVVAAGGSGVSPAYRYYDAQPLSGLSYYRLKMIDLDGTYAYSDIRSAVSLATLERYLEVYPNPASDRVVLTTSGTVSEVLLRDLSGRLLRKVSSYEKEKNIPLSGLGTGMVLVEVKYADGTIKVGRVVIAQ